MTNKKQIHTNWLFLGIYVTFWYHKNYTWEKSQRHKQAPAKTCSFIAKKEKKGALGKHPENTEHL